MKRIFNKFNPKSYQRISLKKLFLFTSIIFCFSLTNFSLTNIEAQELKLGVILHLTGDFAMQSRAFREGIELAQHESQSNLEQKLKVKLLIEDGQNLPKASFSAAKKLASFDKVDALLLTTALDAKSDSALLEKAKIPALVLWDSSPEIDALGEYIFSIGPSIPGCAEVAAKFASTKLSAKTALVIKSEDAFSDEVAQAFVKEFDQDSRKTIQVVSLPRNTADFRSLITKLKALNVEVVYAPVTTDILSFYTQLKSLGFKPPVISCNCITEEHIKQAPQAFEGIYSTYMAEPASEKMNILRRNYQDFFKKDLTLPWFVATGYDAFTIILKAAQEGTGKIKENLQQGKFAGAAREYVFTQGGSAPDYEKIFRIRAGEYELVK